MRWTDVHPKVAAGGIGGALSVVFLFFLGAYGHVAVPPEVAAAVATVFTFGAGYLATGDAGPSRFGEGVQVGSEIAASRQTPPGGNLGAVATGTIPPPPTP